MVIGALLGLPQGMMDFIIALITSALVSSLLSFVAGSLIEALTGNLLKSIFLNIKIKGFHFSLSFFFIATLILRWVAF